MHIAILCRSCDPPNSVANVALQHAAELAAQGVQLSLLSDAFPRHLPPGVRTQRVRALRFEWLHRLGHLPTALAFALTALFSLRRLDRKHPVDALIVHSHPDAALVGQWWKRRRQRPFALVSHGVIFDRPPGTYDPLLSWLYRRSTRPAFQLADLVVALSPAMAALASKYGAVPERIRLIPNGIDRSEIGLDAMAISPAQQPRQTFRLLFIGTLSAVKGLDLLLEACALLKQQGLPFSLSVVGSGLPDAIGTYQRMAADLAITAEVQFCGSIPRQLLGEIYRQHHLLVLPSRSDPLPTVVLEAMLAGCAVLGTAVGGIPFMLADGEAGALVPPQSPSALATAIALLADDPQRRHALATRAMARAQQRFSWQQCGEQLAAALREICKDQPMASVFRRALR